MSGTARWMVVGLVVGWAASAPAEEPGSLEAAAQRLWEACTEQRKPLTDPADSEAVIACVSRLASVAPTADEAGLYVEASFDSLFDKIFDVELGGRGEIYAAQELDIYSGGNVYIDLDDDNNETGRLFRVLNGADEIACTIYEDGDLDCTGTKSAVVRTESYGERKLYAIEGTENWFEDIGTARLTDGTAVIPIDPVYGETVNLEDYQVFLTPVGAWADLYVLDQGGSSFTVARAQDGPDVAFHYRIVAPRRGFEGVRLEVNDSSDRVTAP